MSSQLERQIAARFKASIGSCLAFNSLTLVENFSPPIQNTPAISVMIMSTVIKTRINTELWTNLSHWWRLPSEGERRRAEYQLNETNSKKPAWTASPKIPPREFDKTSAVQTNAASAR